MSESTNPQREITTYFIKQMKEYLLRSLLWAIVVVVSVTLAQIKSYHPALFGFVFLAGLLGWACGVAMVTFRNQRVWIMGIVGSGVICLSFMLATTVIPMASLPIFFAYDSVRNFYLGHRLWRQSRYLQT